MGVTVFVFDKRISSRQADDPTWIKRQIEAGSKQGLDNPKSTSPRLQKWFDSMRSFFPLIGSAHPDDPFGTEYCFYPNVIEVTFASSVGDEGVLQAWKLAEKHGLRLSVGDELLPLSAPRDSHNFHVSVLHGPKPSAAGTAPNVCFVVFDPDIAHIAPSKARKWVVERLKAGPWRVDSSILTGDQLTLWADQFKARNLESLASEIRFYRDLIFICVAQKDSSLMISPIMELSHKLRLPFEIYVNLK